MANCSQINNTTIKGTSAVTYDSTPLPCTDVTTCDGLNDILSKFDAVICDVKASVDSITEDVISLTEDIMIITEDIININDQLEICCPTTTTTTTLPPTTTTTTTLPPTTTTTSSSSSTTTTSSSSTSTSTSSTSTTSTSSTSTTSTTSTSSTTTTTTTKYCDCYVYEVTITEQDLLDSDTATVYVDVDQVCFSNAFYTFEFTKAGIETICVSRTNTFIEQYIEVDGGYNLTFSQPVKLNQCCTAPMLISINSSSVADPLLCTFALSNSLYISNDGTYNYAYVDSGLTTPFDGEDRWWKIQILGDAIGYVEISTDGQILYPISYC